MGVFGLHTQGLKGATRKILHIEIYIVCIMRSECRPLFWDVAMQS